MRNIVFDTETTGLLDTNPNAQVCELSYIIEEKGKIVSTKNYFFTVNEVDMGAYNVHHMSQRDLELLSNGLKFSDVAQEIHNEIEQCDFIVGHNVQFDINMLNLEFERLGMTPINNSNIFDTMLYTTGRLKLKRANGTIKAPKLVELIKHYNLEESVQENLKKYFKNIRAEAHDSRYDTMATYLITKKL